MVNIVDVHYIIPQIKTSRYNAHCKESDMISILETIKNMDIKTY